MIVNGKVIKTVVRSLGIAEVSGVDRPAQKPATVAIMKRESGDLAKVEVSMALTTMTGGHSHLVTMGGGEHVRRAGETSYVDGHSHPWLIDEAGNITIGHAQGHNHGIEIVSKAETTEAAMKELSGLTAAPDGEDSEPKPGADSTAEPNGTRTEDQNMTQPSNPTAADLAAVQKKHDEEKATLTKRAERAEAIAAMSDGHRTFLKSLKGDEAEAFLKADASEREAVVLKAQESNQVVYTAKDGSVFRKNDDPRLIKMAQDLDKERTERLASQEMAKRADLLKRAAELKHLPGTEEARVAILKGIDAIPDQKDRDAALALLKAQDNGLSSAFQRSGTSAAGDSDDTDELNPIDRMAAEIAKRDGVTFEQAFAKALNTPEGQKAYEKHILAKRQPSRV